MAAGPMPEPVDVVIVDADPTQCRAMAGLIAERALGRFSPRVCSSVAEALGLVGDRKAIVIADVETMGGTERLGDMAGPARPLIATSARGSLNMAVAALKAGATDFLPKPIGAVALLERLEAAIADWPQSRPAPTSEAKKAPPPVIGGTFEGFIGRSPAMQAVYDEIRRMAPSRAPVFITGESGTGKEVAAEAIHAQAGDAARPFVAINCSAIPKDLMESEIFGHVRGSFTGASSDRVGAAELADGGTLFLDEIAEMDLGLQAKLLRFLQSGSFRRVGGSELKTVNVRIVCATNRDPLHEVESGRFRADLFYRLHVLPIRLPALRERPEDIPDLARHFLARFSAEEGRSFRDFAPEAEARLLGHSWPGNVRQLQNVVRRIVVLYDAILVSTDMLPAFEEGGAATAEAMPGVGSRVILPFHEQERRIIEEAIAAFGGNIPRAAAALEISPATIYRKKQSWSVQPSSLGDRVG